MRARTGKIARLPREIREQLNQRLADGMSGEALLIWLHSLPEVLEVLVRDFDARPILKQNLSEWRLGGFRDWEARQERLEQVRQLCEEAEEVQEATSDLPDRLSAILATRFVSLMAATAKVKDWSKPRQRAQLMELGEAIGTLQRFNQGAARLKLESELLDMKRAELQLAQEAQTKRTAEEWRAWMRSCMNLLFKEGKSGDELVIATHRLIFGDVGLEKILAEREAREKDAGGAGQDENETLWDTSDNIVRLREEVQTSRAELAFLENQNKMNQVKAASTILAALEGDAPKEASGISEAASDATNQNLST